MCGVSCSTRVTVARWAGRAGLFGMLIFFRSTTPLAPVRLPSPRPFLPAAREGPARCGSGPAPMTDDLLLPGGARAAPAGERHHREAGQHQHHRAAEEGDRVVAGQREDAAALLG